MAFAADPLEPIEMMDPVYDHVSSWEGFYVGIYGGVQTFADVFGMGGVVLGGNIMLSESILAGVEFDARYLADGPGFIEVFLDGRLGYTLSDDFLVYAKGGVGLFDFSTPIYTFGGGLEFMVADGFSIRGEGGAVGAIGDIPDAFYGSVGLFLHF